MAVFRAFYRSFGRMLFVSVLCFACGFLSAWAEEYTIAYLNQHGDEISDLTPDRYTEEELPLEKENLPNSEAVSIATGCELADELWYWNNEMSEPVDKIESVSDEGTTLYGNLDCGENRIVTLNPGGKEGIGSEGTRTLYYYRNLGESGEFFYNEYNGSKSASRVASSIVLPTYDTEEYTFLGYYADPEDLETQCIDERGYITEYGIQQMAEGGEGETSWDAVYEVTIPGQYTVSYTCGANGSGNPASQSINSYGDIVLHPASVCTPDSGYEFFGWSCYFPGSSPDTTVRAAGESIFVNGSGICTALWVAACPNSGVHESILDDYLGSSADLVNSGFSSYATVSISGKCSSTPGQYQFQSQVSEPASGAGYCWCHITSLSDTGGANSSNVSSYSPWMFINDTYTCSSDSDCTSPCSRYSYSFAAERISLTDACAYNLSYTCGVISGSVSSPQSDTVFVNETVNLQQSVSGCTYVWGATFLGWDCHVPGNSTTINNGYSLTMPPNNVVCDALWDAPQYTLTYVCGVNGTEPASVTQAGGSDVTLANGCTGAVSSNYDFNGWYCISGSSVMGAAYNGGDLYTLYDNTTCTAIWTESNPCDPGFVSHQEIVGVFDENSFEEYNWTDHSLFWEFPAGSGQTVSLTGMCSNTPGMFGVAGNPTQTGTIADTYCWCQVTTYGSTPLSGYPWVYSGFNTTDCDTSSCSAVCAGETPGIVWDNPDAQELFLQSLFIKNICEYTLTYDCNNGNNAQSALSGGTYEGGQSIGLWAGGGNCIAPNGQAFDYWSCDNNIGIPPNNTVNPTPYNNMTCTAYWANIPVPTYSLTYNCNNNGAGGSAPTDSNSPYYAGTTNISLVSDEGNCNPPSNGMVFSNWNCHKENDNSIVFNEGDSMPAYNVVCDAQWGQIYNVIYNCNNNGAGGAAPASQPYFVGDTVSLLTTMPQNTCTAPNMLFDRWDCHKENDNTVPFNNGDAMQAYNVVCDAQWVHRVQYDCGSGTQITPNVYVTTSDASVILADNSSLCTPAQGYVFYKWSCSPNGYFYDSGYNYVFTSPFVLCTAVYREVSCNSGETTVPFVLGQEMTLTDWENNSSVWGGYSNITLGDLWNPTSASYSGNSAAFSNSSSNWTVTMNGKCSNTWWMPGETGHPSDSPGDHCWCQAGSVVVNGSSTTLINYPWVYQGQITEGCTTNSCANICAIGAANGYGYSTDMANFFLQSLYTQNTCVSAPATYKVTYHSGTCVPSAPDYQSDPINAGDSYIVENPNCAFANSNYFIPTDNCYEFVGWSENNPAQVQNPTIDYNNCDNCTTQTGSCGTINSVSANIDLYAICNVKNHSVIYHDCDDTYTYTDSNAVWIGQSPNYTPLSPSVAPLSSSNLEIDPLSSFQGWATSPMDDDDKSWCTYGSDDLYPILYGGNGKKTKYNYSVSADKLCHDIHLYAVCCPLNLSWILNGGQWPTDPNNQTTLQNQTSCEYGAIAGQSGSIGYGQTPLRTPLKTGYTFNGWLVTGYTP